jgi:hypothetical protein
MDASCLTDVHPLFILCLTFRGIMLNLGENQIVQVTGDRKWSDWDIIEKILQPLPRSIQFIHGYADGLDSMLHVVATELGFNNIIRCPSHWRHNEKRWVEVYGPCSDECKEVVGRAAGVIRNNYMLKTYQAKIVLGFHDDILNSRGTLDMMKRAEKHNLKRWLFTSRGEAIKNPILTKPPESIILNQDWFTF